MSLPKLSHEPNGLLHALLKSNTDPEAILHALELQLLRSPLNPDDNGVNLLGVWMGRMNVCRPVDAWRDLGPDSPLPAPSEMDMHLRVTQALVEGGCDPFQVTGVVLNRENQLPHLWRHAPHGYTSYPPQHNRAPTTAWILAFSKGHLPLLERWQLMPKAPKGKMLDKMMVDGLGPTARGEIEQHDYRYLGQMVPLLHAATVANRTDLVNFLLHHGADIEARDTKGRTPLFYAHSADMVDLLMRRGADCTAKCAAGRDAMAMWARALDKAVAVAPLQEALLKHLDNLPADARREILMPSLFSAAERGMRNGFEQIWKQGQFAKNNGPLALRNEEGQSEGIGPRVVRQRWAQGTEPQPADGMLAPRKKEWAHQTIPGTPDGWWWVVGQPGSLLTQPALLAWVKQQLDEGQSITLHLGSILNHAQLSPARTSMAIANFLFGMVVTEGGADWAGSADGQAAIQMFWNHWKKASAADDGITTGAPNLVLNDTWRMQLQQQLAGLACGAVALKKNPYSYDQETLLKKIQDIPLIEAPVELLGGTTQARLGKALYQKVAAGVEKHALQAQLGERSGASRRSARL